MRHTLFIFMLFALLSACKSKNSDSPPQTSGTSSSTGGAISCTNKANNPLAFIPELSLPAQGEQLSNGTQNFILQFSKDIDPSSIITNAVNTSSNTIVLCKYTNSSNCQSLPIHTRIQNDQVIVEFQGQDYLEPDSSFDLKISGDILSVSGDYLTCHESISFSTDSTQRDINVQARLSWDIPTERENGERLPLYEIGGYKIRRKSQTQDSWNSTTIADGQQDELMMDFQQGQTYTLQISAFDSNGLESEWSDPLTFTAQ